MISDDEHEVCRAEPEKYVAEVPETVAVPGQKREGKPKPFKASNLQARVTAIWTDLQQCAREFLKPAVSKIIDRWNDI